jgi:hypothetical protein
MLGALRRLAANRDMVDTQHEALATLQDQRRRNWMVFFATHPPLEVRIAGARANASNAARLPSDHEVQLRVEVSDVDVCLLRLLRELIAAA